MTLSLLKIKSSINHNISSTYPSRSAFLQSQSLHQVETYYFRTSNFKNYFFLYTIVQCNKLDLDIQKSKSYTIFQNTLLKIGLPNQLSVYRFHNPIRLKLLTRLRVGLSHLHEHIFKNHFQSCINLLCSCCLEIESTTHFLLQCHHFSNICSIL